MLSRIIYFTSLTLILSTASRLYSQYPYTIEKENLLDGQATELKNFSEFIYGKDVRLVNGKIYSQPFPKATGHPFMKSTTWMNGSVTVNGKEFTGLKLNYDIYQDFLIYLDESRKGEKRSILLNKYNIDGFTLDEDKFVTLKTNDAGNLDEIQYFEVLYKGKVSLFNKWTRNFEPVTSQEFPAGRFLETKVSRYILKDKVLYKVSNKIALIKICADRKGELRKYMRKNKIDFRKGSDEPLAEMIKYYNSLVKD